MCKIEDAESFWPGAQKISKVTSLVNGVSPLQYGDLETLHYLHSLRGTMWSSYIILIHAFKILAKSDAASTKKCTNAVPCAVGAEDACGQLSLHGTSGLFEVLALAACNESRCTDSISTNNVSA